MLCLTIHNQKEEPTERQQTITYIQGRLNPSLTDVGTSSDNKATYVKHTTFCFKARDHRDQAGGIVDTTKVKEVNSADIYPMLPITPKIPTILVDSTNKEE